MKTEVNLENILKKKFFNGKFIELHSGDVEEVKECMKEAINEALKLPCKKCGQVYNCACGGNCTEDH